MPRRDRPIVVGRLVEHGRAPYRFRVGQDLSYFVNFVTSDGMSILWGQDLARALRTAVTRPQIGDLVGARRVSREGVSFHPARARYAWKNRPRDRASRLPHALGTREGQTLYGPRAPCAPRPDRQIDARAAVREHPELKSAFLTLRAAEAIAARRIPDPRDRARFVALIREAMGDSVARGEPLRHAPAREAKSHGPGSGARSAQAARRSGAVAAEKKKKVSPQGLLAWRAARERANLPAIQLEHAHVVREDS